MTQVTEYQRTDSGSDDRVHTNLFAFSYRLIGNVAQFFGTLRRGNRQELMLKVPRTGRKLHALIVGAAFLASFGLSWLGGFISHRVPESGTQGISKEQSRQAVVDRIIAVESNGDQNARNKRSSALGLGQFLDQTWLDLIRAYRRDLATGRSQEAILELRRDQTIAREITALHIKQNATILEKRGLPVTPSTLYLAHFAGPAGAVAILSAVENADAASIMACADATGRTTRETIVKANPFLRNFTVADLRSWADRRMRFPGS